MAQTGLKSRQEIREAALTQQKLMIILPSTLSVFLFFQISPAGLTLKTMVVSALGRETNLIALTRPAQIRKLA